MSAGHREHSQGLDKNRLDRVLRNPEVQQRIWRPRTLCRDYDMPYLGGYSRDGSVLYLDRHLPEELELVLDNFKKLVRPEWFLTDYKGHEPVEWSIMDALEWEYGPAHEVATACERRLVLQCLGPNWWGPWQSCIEKYVKADEHERIVKMPADYDMRPILYPPVDHSLLEHVQRAMGARQSKFSKDQVAYTDQGTQEEHCGPVRSWPTEGRCSHYLGSGACEVVRGDVKPRGWCKRWTDRTDEIADGQAIQ